ncbi:MAG: aminoglycoside phosphotransferase [Betaproteobacteria bacterium RBG_16_58_11]|nr:MAG: aminoglycoside phosphotransferase [Betaproteobacteria bacterium RBG_16_58_11]OFZ99899.1 MAG: aminoglycoside phosphotransferase [Betaproteobacteria bacterium RBG_19FT_COMBO_58_11]
MDRVAILQDWLRQVLPGKDFSLAPASSDASFRRYFRVSLSDRTLIAMDAPPAHENCAPFIHVAQLFLAAGVHVPEILAQELQQGFLLLSDLGAETYLDQLNEQNADMLYRAANEALIKIQLASKPAELPPYDEALLLREMRLFPDWYIAQHLHLTLTPGQSETLEQAFQSILKNVLAQPRVYVHRDYHSRNLMLSDPNPGVLDFQDAVYGPISYDLVSLYKDAYIAWDEERVVDWAVRYWEKAKCAHLPVAQDFGDFYRDFEWVGVQRHLKVLGIFARLYHRDGKEGYLKDMPLVMHYLRRACDRYRALGPLLQLLDQLHGSEQQAGYTF